MERVTFKVREIAEVYVTDSETWFVCKVRHVDENRQGKPREYGVTVLPFEADYGPNNGWHYFPRAENMRKLRPRKE